MIWHIFEYKNDYTKLNVRELYKSRAAKKVLHQGFLKNIMKQMKFLHNMADTLQNTSYKKAMI